MHRREAIHITVLASCYVDIIAGEAVTMFGKNDMSHSQLLRSMVSWEYPDDSY
jgi:alpha-D-ribose 1-methylphosphonate 5-triphosphate synthase subunit PhnL